MLTTAEKVEIILLAKQFSIQKTAELFKIDHNKEISYSTVFRLLRCYQLGDMETKLHNRGRKGLTMEKINAVLAYVHLKPVSSCREIATNLGISHTSVLNILKRSKYRPYRLREVHYMLPSDRRERYVFANTIFNSNIPINRTVIHSYVSRFNSVFLSDFLR